MRLSSTLYLHKETEIHSDVKRVATARMARELIEH